MAKVPELKDIDKVKNTKRKFGEVSEEEGMWPAFRIKADGKKVPILLIESELDGAEYRAQRNMEDMPSGDTSWIRDLFFG